MTQIGIGIVGGGYMGKAHSVAMRAVGAVFNTRLRPVLRCVAASTPDSAARYRQAFGFEHAAAHWQDLVEDPEVEAVVIASPQSTHRDIAEAAFVLGKPVLCEKPLGDSYEACRAMLDAAHRAGAAHMVGYNYIRAPAAQYACQLIAEGAIGEIVWFSGQHAEDFLADPATPANWRTQDGASGTIGDLAPHMINAALKLVGPIRSLVADVETVHEVRPGRDGPESVENDDQAQFLCRFERGAMGRLHFSRVATGRKMGFAFDVTGTLGAIRFDCEDQNALWVYRAEGPEAGRGFRKILTGPAHPDYVAFCLGPGHGTGFQDQIIIEARDFLHAIDSGEPVWPTFEDGLAVHRVIDAVNRSQHKRGWVTVGTDSPSAV